MLLALLVIAFQVPAEPIDPAVYLSFFNEAAHHADTQTSTYAGTLNGEPAGESTQLSIADSLRITSEQAQSLVQIASLCQGDVNTLDAKARALTFEARLAAANEEKLSPAVAEQLAAVSARRTEVIASYVSRLRESLGTATFERVENYVRLRTGTGSFFPIAGAPKKL